MLHNNNDILVAKDVCHSIDVTLVVSANGRLDDHQIAVQIIYSLSKDDVPSAWKWSKHVWKIEFALYDGFSLHVHERHDAYNKALAEWERPSRDGV